MNSLGRRRACWALLAALAGTLAGLWSAGVLTPAAGSGSVPFAVRGVIQAQYGPQFDAAGRKRLLRFMARHGYNAYFHAPKGDPYQRTLWRQPYPAGQQAELDAEMTLAARLGIAWVPNVSPAAAKYPSPAEPHPKGSSPSAPVCFSSDADLGELLAKLAPFRAAGARAFMVSFDDVRRRFYCPGDYAAYGRGAHAFGLANADLLDRLYAKLRAADPDARLLTVASDYHGTADTDYLRGFRERLVPGIEVMWTGAATASRPFSGADADAYGALVGRAPIVWENWTANDFLTAPGQRPDRVFLGPYSRSPRLAGHVGGFVFNLANQSDLNFLPLATAGAWLRNPTHYRPRRAFLRQTRKLAGRQAPYLRAFAEANYSTTLRRSVEAPTLRRLINHFLRVRARGHSGGARVAARLRHQLQLATAARRHLLKVRRLRHFVAQARPYLRSTRLNADAGLIATDLLQARHRKERRELRLRLRGALRRAARAPTETYGSRAGVLGLTGNVIDRFAKRVRFRVHHHTRQAR
jgi:hyaluronoglucosaminidase